MTAKISKPANKQSANYQDDKNYETKTTVKKSIGKPTLNNPVNLPYNTDNAPEDNCPSDEIRPQRS